MIEKEGQLDEELSQRFYEGDEDIGWTSTPKIYNLSNNRCLFVFNEDDPYLDGKGDIYTRENMLRMARWCEKVDEAYARGGGDSVSEWLYYTQLGEDLVKNIDFLLNELSSITKINSPALDKTYKSLNMLSDYVDQIGSDRAQTTIYDHLVAYVGEVLKTRIDGNWAVSLEPDGESYPYIKSYKSSYKLMPINVVFTEVDGLHDCDLRQETINEYRRYADAVRYSSS